MNRLLCHSIFNPHIHIHPHLPTHLCFLQCPITLTHPHPSPIQHLQFISPLLELLPTISYVPFRLPLLSKESMFVLGLPQRKFLKVSVSILAVFTRPLLIELFSNLQSVRHMDNFFLLLPYPTITNPRSLLPPSLQSPVMCLPLPHLYTLTRSTSRRKQPDVPQRRPPALKLSMKVMHARGRITLPPLKRLRAQILSQLLDLGPISTRAMEDQPTTTSRKKMRRRLVPRR